MKPLIKITNIKRDFVLGNEIVYVLKGIDLEIKKRGICGTYGPFRFRKINIDESFGMFGHANFRFLHSQRKRRKPDAR